LNRPRQLAAQLAAQRAGFVAGLVATMLAAADPVPASGTPSATSLRAIAVGDIADCRRHAAPDTIAWRTAGLVPPGALVLALGDVAYQYADAATLASCYEPTWGRHRAMTLAIAGNHDYKSGDASDFRRYFGFDDVGDARFVAYDRWLNEHWFLVALDSNVAGVALDAQFEWLRQVLASEFGPPGEPGTKKRCIAALWHAPLFSSGLHRGGGEHMRRYWELLDSYGADLLLSGHEHFYEAFEPMDSTGALHADGDGIRQFVVGTGGARLYGFWKLPYASRARVLRHGVLDLELKEATYHWRFVGLDGRAYDAGAAPCRHGT
jgi:hypothetical protein